MKTLSNFRVRLGIAAALMLGGIAGVYSAMTFNPAAQPYAYVPPLALSGFDLSKGDQKVFQTWFDPNVWRGDLVAYPVDATGQTDVNNRLWYASDRLALQNWDMGRRIITRNGATNVAFRWGNLSAGQQASLGDATVGPKTLNFIRGDRSNEKEFVEEAGDGTLTILSGSASGIFRARASVLGDIVHAKPVHVGPPPAGYLFDGYPAFKTANSTRAGMVYVGANDGMLHAFNAATGDEVFAYVPSMVIGNLNKLKEVAYQHVYFLDGGLAVSDAYLGAGLGGGWRTVLVGGLGAGGKGLYALDVTDPTAADEESAKKKILWEITPATAGFADLGDTYGDPIIVRLNTGKWAAIIGNGYNNTGSYRAVLYVVDLATGALIKSIDTGAGSLASPNGLSGPTAIDSNGDGKVDSVYAGDLDGTLWKFDLSSSSPAAWTRAALFTGAKSIVATPDVSGHPLGGYLVHFATGSLFTKDMAKDALVQHYAYGIWDGAPLANLAILEQKLTEASYGDQRVRVSTGYPINWRDTTAVATNPLHRGWRTALQPGEHVVGTGFVRDGRYHFTSVIPSVVNNPGPNGENWLIELDHLTGATNGKLIFDLNGKDGVTDADRVKTGAGSPVPGAAGIPVGIHLGSGLYSQPVLALLSAQFSTTLFNKNPFLNPGDGPAELPPPATADIGVSKGHFDYDVYHGANMASFKHVHRYDDKYNVVGANFLNASDPTFNLANASIAGNRVTAESKFFVLVSNGDLSPGVTLTVGGKDYKAYEFPNKFNGSQDIFTTSSVPLFQFRMPADAFTAKDWGTGVVRAGLIPTTTGCVKSFPFTPGAEGEVHNGALTIWIVKEGAPASAIALNVAGKPERGYKVIDDKWVLKKYTVFWHYGGLCYGKLGWIPNPAADMDADSPGRGVTPASGSLDPRGSTPGSGTVATPRAPVTVTSTSTTFTASGTYNGKSDKSGTRVTTTVYSDGSTLVVTETINAKGRVTSSVSVKTAPTGGTGGTPGPATTGPAKKTKASNTRTGFQQLRQGGKVGRVAWHELIKE